MQTCKHAHLKNKHTDKHTHSYIKKTTKRKRKRHSEKSPKEKVEIEKKAQQRNEMPNMKINTEADRLSGKHPPTPGA